MVIDRHVVGLALALGVYMTVVVLPLLILVGLATSGRTLSLLSRIDARLWGSLGGAIAGACLALVMALEAGAAAPSALLWLLGVLMPILAAAGSALGCRVAGTLRANRGGRSHPRINGLDDVDGPRKIA